jgi:DNA-binding SARP family transcriptional activator
VAPTERLDFRLCGGVRVSCGDEDLDLSKTARQGRLALAWLVIHHGEVITYDELMERVRSEPDPERASASLSQTLSRLRQVLGRDRIERLPGPAVRLREPVRVDIDHAGEMLKEGQQALETGEWTAASKAAQAALAELSGQVLAGDEADWLEEIRRDVDELRFETLKLHATASLRIGAWGEALASARSAVAMSETNEAAWGLLIEAQAAQGDVALATQTFHELRRRLRDEFGVDPSRDLIELHRRVLEGELTDDRPAPRDRPLEFPPALSLESGDQPFVGRESALARLRERYEAAQRGTRQAVVLSGEPGIGKTRLASEFAREAHSAGAIVLYGRADADAQVPYKPFAAALGHYVTQRGGQALARELGAALSELSPLLPDLRRHLPELREPLAVEPEMRHYRLYNAVLNVLSFVARERPCVLVLDDLQWADASTGRLLLYVVQEIHDVKLLIVGTLRDDEPPRSEQVADFVARPQHGAEHVSMAGLDARETADLVMVRQGREATGTAIGVLLRATGGNPLLLEETLKSVGESDASVTVSEQAVRRVRVPETARRVIGRRLARLTPSTQRVLAHASVVGAEFDVRVIEALAGPSVDEVIPALEEAQAAGLLREVPDGFSFSHALVREALQDDQSIAGRRRLHHRIGDALEALGESTVVHPAELAHHFSESRDPDDAGKALKYSLQAGDRATEAFAHEDAAGHFRRAQRLLVPTDERLRCEILLKLGLVELRQGNREESRQIFQHASELATQIEAPELFGRAAFGFASRYTEAGIVDLEGIAMLRAAREAVGDRPGAIRAQLTARLANNLHFAPDAGEAERLSAEALAIARAIEDPDALAAALDSRHSALLSVEHLDERLRLSQELVDLAQQVGDRELEALGHHWRIYDLLEAARVRDAAHERDALAACAEALHQPLYHHFCVGWDVVWAHFAGRVNEVEALAQRFYDLGMEASARDTKTIHRAQVMALRRRQERLSDFVSTVEEAVEADPTLLAWRAALPLAHLASGDPRAAFAEFEWFAQDDFGRVRHDMFWFPTVCILAETCALLRDTDRAPVLYAMLEPFRERNVQVTQAACWGSSERFLGLLAATLGRWEAATGHLESAIAKNESDGNVPAASLVRRDLARLLVARRTPADLDRAAELLKEPLRAAQAAQTPSLIVRIQAEIDAVDRERRAIA